MISLESSSPSLFGNPCHTFCLLAILNFPSSKNCSRLSAALISHENVAPVQAPAPFCIHARSQACFAFWTRKTDVRDPCRTFCVSAVPIFVPKILKSSCSASSKSCCRPSPGTIFINMLMNMSLPSKPRQHFGEVGARADLRGSPLFLDSEN